ncbi:hypothetical protein CC117_28875 [Parafrankia colletiae]|uniref:Uncharacterized protein n=1 Tax=Parafrankia colletiae TaxID=573497 RepID=A0A1S1Q901_9ACTN|nr:hypothetical protein CC117_28875 [Parafrankia colletiae]
MALQHTAGAPPVDTGRLRDDGEPCRRTAGALRSLREVVDDGRDGLGGQLEQLQELRRDDTGADETDSRSVSTCRGTGTT